LELKSLHILAYKLYWVFLSLFCIFFRSNWICSSSLVGIPLFQYKNFIPVFIVLVFKLLFVYEYDGHTVSWLHLSLWTPQRSSISISWSEHTSLIWQCKLSVLWKKAARMPLLYFAEKDVLEKDVQLDCNGPPF